MGCANFVQDVVFSARLLDYLLSRTNDRTLPSNKHGVDITDVTIENSPNSVITNSTVHTNDNPTPLSKQETYLLETYNSLNVKEQTKFMSMVYDFEETLQQIAQ